MKLECASGVFLQNATDEDIHRIFAVGFKRGEYVVLSKSDQEYIQIGGDDEPYTLEYRDGDLERHFQCAQNPSLPELAGIFLKYLQGDSSWKADFKWKQLDLSKPWWRFW